MEKLAAIVLAAGGSVRFGKPKQLVPFRGESLVRRLVAAAQQAGCRPVLVVTGAHAKAIESELAGSDSVIIENERWKDGIGSSIRIGVEQLDSSVAAVIVLACDQPLVDGQTLGSLIALHESTGKPIVACAYAGTLGIPALFARSSFVELTNLGSSHGAKKLLLSRRAEVASLDFPEGATDIDTAADYERLLAREEPNKSDIIPLWPPQRS